MNSQAATLPPIRPTEHFGVDGNMHKVLDMRVANVIGDDLNRLIVESVKATQVLHGIDLPDMITLSHKQFISVEKNTQEMDRTTDRIYITPYNVMEVTVDKDYQTVDEDMLDILVGYDDAESMGTSKEEVKGIILNDK